MAFVAVDKNGCEYIYHEEPFRADNEFWESPCDYVEMSKGSIKKLIGRELTWEDDPVELKEEQP